MRACLCSISPSLPAVYQVTFFVACVTIDARRQAAGVPDGCCCRRQRPKPPTITSASTGAVGSDNALVTTSSVVHVGGAGAAAPASSAAETPEVPKASVVPHVSPAERLVARWLPSVSLHPVGKVVVLLVTGGLLSAGAVGVVRQKLGAFSEHRHACVARRGVGSTPQCMSVCVCARWRLSNESARLAFTLT